jgi:hypothetical protein
MRKMVDDSTAATDDDGTVARVKAADDLIALTEDLGLYDDAVAPGPVVYPGPAESPETKLGLFTRQVTRASLERDWYALSALRLAAERWLHESGITQWTDTARGLDQMMKYTDRDEMYLVREGPTAVGCFALTNRPDPDFWSGDAERDECLYLNKAIAAPWAAHTGIGRLITDYTMTEARARKCVAARLDCWRGNEKLRQHFESLGFTYLRTVESRGRNDGILMEQRVAVDDDSGEDE